MPNVEEWWPLKWRMESGQSTKWVSAVSEIFVHFFFKKSVANNIKVDNFGCWVFILYI